MTALNEALVDLLNANGELVATNVRRDSLTTAAAPATPAPLREIVCSNCGEPLGEYSRTERTKVGRCCFNLPDPWDLPGEESDDVADQDAEDAECDCFDCRMDRGRVDHWDFVDEGRSLEDFAEYTQSRWDREPMDYEARAWTS